jgi:glycolate oxidase iron-sulfur subunit
MKTSSTLSDTDLCVMCGMCLPQCPTYQLYQSEAESPRGRIALMQAIDQGNISTDHKTLTHIDHCLGCLNCQTICPSRVPYGRLIDEFRQQYAADIAKPATARWLLGQIASSRGLRPYASALNIPLVKPLARGVSAISGRHQPSVDALLGQTASSLKPFYPAKTGNVQGEVRLFSGCVGTLADSTTLRDAAQLLNQLGFNVHIPTEQSCCGALHQHNGQTTSANQLLNNTQQLLENAGESPLLFFSPACGQQLSKSESLQVVDARLFILQQLQQQSCTFKPLEKPVALHESCGHRNMSPQRGLNRELLQLIPQLELIESSNPSLCCGAGGLQGLNYPEQGQALAEQKAASFELQQTELLISDNIGCSLHMKTALRRYNKLIEVIHPVSLLARQLVSNSQPLSQQTDQ